MRFLAVHGAAERALALVRDHHVHQGRLADDAAGGLEALFGEHFDQAAHAQAADLFVVGKREMDRRLQVGGEKARRHGQGGAEIAFHVAGAAREQAAIADGRLERVGVPGLAVDRHHVGMAGEHDAGARCVAALAVNRGKQVGLALVRVVDQGGLDAVGLQPVAHPLDQAQVGFSAGGVEGNELLDHFQRFGFGGGDAFGFHDGL